MNIFIKVTLTDRYGRKVEVIDDATEVTISIGVCKFRRCLFKSCLWAAFFVYSALVWLGVL